MQKHRTFHVCFHDRIMQKHDPIVDIFHLPRVLSVLPPSLLDFYWFSIDFYWFSLIFYWFSLIFYWFPRNLEQSVGTFPFPYSAVCQPAVDSFTWVRACTINLLPFSSKFSPSKNFFFACKIAKGMSIGDRQGGMSISDRQRGMSIFFDQKH